MKILIIGLGGIGQRHVRNLRALLGDRAEILAYRQRGLSHVVTPTLQSDPAKDVEREYNLRVFSNLEAALDEKPQVAFICNPSRLHVPVALACARAGCDLFLEKPVSDDLNDVAELLQVVERNQRIVMVGYQLRFHPCLRRLQEIVAGGALGRLLAVRAVVGEYLPGWHPYEDYRQMYASRAALGGGVIVTQIHEFDYLYSLFGLPVRMFSLGGHWSNLEIDVEDTASTLMEFRVDGHTLPVHLQQDYVQRPPQRGCEIVGAAGKAAMDLAALSVTLYNAEGKTTGVESWAGFERNQLFLDELSHFLDCVSLRKKPVVDLKDGIASLRMALAARESISKGQLVELTSLSGEDA